MATTESLTERHTLSLHDSLPIYERLSIEAFGSHLLRSGDLDPIYIALVQARRSGAFSEAQLLLWLLAYVCFYHAGVASWMSEHEGAAFRSEEHTSELQSLMRISYAVFCLTKKKQNHRTNM